MDTMSLEVTVIVWGGVCRTQRYDDDYYDDDWQTDRQRETETLVRQKGRKRETYLQISIFDTSSFDRSSASYVWLVRNKEFLL